VLPGKDHPDEADRCVAVGEDADDVGAPADLLVQTLLRVDGIDLAVYRPLDLYAEAVRPSFDEMDFVDMYFMLWLDASGSVVSGFNIYPEQMRMHLDGEISVKELSEKISTCGP
jgi:hypothetical protein